MALALGIVSMLLIPIPFGRIVIAGVLAFVWMIAANMIAAKSG